MDFPAEFSEAYKLPTAPYFTPKLAHITPKETMLTRMGGVGVTNATSAVPVIGTIAFNICTAIILYNRKTKTAAVGHESELYPEHFQELLEKVRDNEEDHIDLHLIGAPIMMDEEDKDAQNEISITSLQGILEESKRTANVVIVTFDILNKPKPYNVALDTRTGNLIRGTALFKTMEDADVDIFAGCASDLFKNWPSTRNADDNFDGTTPRMQRSTKR